MFFIKPRKNNDVIFDIYAKQDNEFRIVKMGSIYQFDALYFKAEFNSNMYVNIQDLEAFARILEKSSEFDTNHTNIWNDGYIIGWIIYKQDGPPLKQLLYNVTQKQQELIELYIDCGH